MARWRAARGREPRAARPRHRRARSALRGQLCFTLPEALWLADKGFADLVVAYPTADRAALRALAHGPHRGAIAVMVDSRAHLDLIEAAGGGPVRVCLDIDAGWWVLGGRIRVGVKRSPVRTPEQASALAADAAARAGIELVGLMAYAAHIAGIGDAPPGRRVHGAAVRAMQRASARELAARRAAVVAAVREVQTPVLGPGARDLALGDRVWFRHAKAGELCERFASLHLVRGEELVDEVPTYRGEGQTFL